MSKEWNNKDGRIQVALSQYTGCVLAGEDTVFVCEELSSLLDTASKEKVDEVLVAMEIADRDSGGLVSRNLQRKPRRR